VFQHFPDPAIGLGYVRELGRVLRPGGWAAIQIPNDPAAHRRPNALSTGLRALARRGPKGQRQSAWVGSHLELGDVRAVADEAGLAMEDIRGQRSQHRQVLLRQGPVRRW
jgi:SAM-dependent methyltransferase